MKDLYQVRPEYTDQWFGSEIPEPVDMDEIKRLAGEWEMPIDALMAQVAPFSARTLNLCNGNPAQDITIDELEAHRPEIIHAWDALVAIMDDGTRERVASELAPCDELAFLRRYLELAPGNLVLG